MVRATRRRPIDVDPDAKVWTVEEDVYLIENQEMPVEEQAVMLGCSEEDVSHRRAILGLLQRARAIIRLAEV